MKEEEASRLFGAMEHSRVGRGSLQAGVIAGALLCPRPSIPSTQKGLVWLSLSTIARSVPYWQRLLLTAVSDKSTGEPRNIGRPVGSDNSSETRADTPDEREETT